MKIKKNINILTNYDHLVVFLKFLFNNLFNKLE